MEISRKLAMFLMPALLSAALSAAAFPQAGKPVRLVVPFSAGSPAFDGRTWSNHFSDAGDAER